MQTTNAEAFLSTLVRTWREGRGWSQQMLADQLRQQGMDIHPTGLTRLEQGQRAIRLNEALALARVFGLDAQMLLGALGQVDAAGARPVDLPGRLDAALQSADYAHGQITSVLRDLQAALRGVTFSQPGALDG